jgi:hypothetical protein
MVKTYQATVLLSIVEYLVIVASLDDHMKNILLELVLCQKVGAALLLEKKLQKQFCWFKFTDKFE